MSFVAIEQSEVAEGAPATQNLFQKIKDNFDEHEAQVAELHKKTVTMALIFGG